MCSPTVVSFQMKVKFKNWVSSWKIENWSYVLASWVNDCFWGIFCYNIYMPLFVACRLKLAACCEICEFLLKYLLSIFRQTNGSSKSGTDGRGVSAVIECSSCLWATDADSLMCIEQNAAQWFQITASNRRNLSSAEVAPRRGNGPTTDIHTLLCTPHPPSRFSRFTEEYHKRGPYCY